jgi:2-polyprenyl-3-methyl-5-hydroxy-6-metoxy-1,4-benzoquinol methylase
MANEHKRDADYVLGHSARELERLSTQARLYEPFTMQFFRDAGIKAGMRVLDVGCGSGDVSFLAARMVGPTGEVVGVDRVPAAVATATRRALELQLSNTRFVEGDPREIAFGRPFDAVVGRMVLVFSHDPSDMLCKLAAHVRPGGVIAFQETDFTGCRSLPALPLFNRCVRWIAESLERSGADTYLGLKLYAAFRTAGLPGPALCVHAGIGAGPDHPLYSVVADLIRALLPALEELGLATAADVDVETLRRRLSDEAVAAGGTAVGPSLVGASCVLPERST